MLPYKLWGQKVIAMCCGGQLALVPSTFSGWIRVHSTLLARLYSTHCLHDYLLSNVYGSFFRLLAIFLLPFVLLHGCISRTSYVIGYISLTFYVINCIFISKTKDSSQSL